jgi:anti-sigma regulatory factor (Ser/Thr protein kinase)
VEDVTLLGSELATNAVVHARTEYEVTVLVSEDLVRVEVWDLDPQLPLARSADGRPGGRGLPLVEALAYRWGAETRPEGKVVWFEASA